MSDDDLKERLREDQPVTQDMVSTMQCDLQNEAAARIEELEAQLAKAMAGLEESQREIDQYIQFEYPSDHPVHERYRKRDFSANPARLALTEIKGEQKCT